MRVLVIQTAFLGDIVLTTPFLDALTKLWPAAELHIVTTSQGKDVLDGFPQVKIHVLEKKKLGKLESIARVLESLGSESFDYVFSVHRSLRSLFLGRRVRAKKRIAFHSFWAKVLGYETVKYPPYSEDFHYADKPMVLLQALGLDVKRGARPHLIVTDQDRADAVPKLADLMTGKYIVMSPFSVWGTKMWFADRFAKLGAKLVERFRCPIVLVGNGNSLQIVTAQTIAEKISEHQENEPQRKVINLVNQTSIGQLKAVISGARLVIANDSAPIHIAAAFNVPTVAIFGPTVKKWGFFPLASKHVVVERAGLACRPCHIHGPQRCPQGHFRCMDEITVEDVASAVQTIIIDEGRS